MIRIYYQGVYYEFRPNIGSNPNITYDQLIYQFTKEGPQIHLSQVGTLVEGTVDQRQSGDTLLGIGYGRAGGRVDQGALLHVQQR